jgi:hypothetical protein
MHALCACIAICKTSCMQDQLGFVAGIGTCMLSIVAILSAAIHTDTLHEQAMIAIKTA